VLGQPTLAYEALCCAIWIHVFLGRSRQGDGATWCPDLYLAVAVCNFVFIGTRLRTAVRVMNFAMRTRVPRLLRRAENYFRVYYFYFFHVVSLNESRQLRPPWILLMWLLGCTPQTRSSNASVLVKIYLSLACLIYTSPAVPLFAVIDSAYSLLLTMGAIGQKSIGDALPSLVRRVKRPGLWLRFSSLGCFRIAPLLLRSFTSETSIRVLN